MEGIYNGKEKAVLYCRVACYNQANNALDDQEQVLKKYAKTQNYEIIETVRETCGGTSLNRPGINKIYEIVDKGKVDAVIAKNISRYGRCPLTEIVNFVELLEKKKVKVLTIQDGNLQNIIQILKSIS